MDHRFRKLFADKRAVTPVLSNLLLMVIAVAAMALATTATYVITTNLRETMSERVIIEDVWFNNLDGSVSVYLSNVGKIAVRVSGVYVNHTSQYFTKPFILEIGEHGWLNIPQSWVFDSLYHVDIVTTRGTHVEGHYKSP